MLYILSNKEIFERTVDNVVGDPRDLTSAEFEKAISSNKIIHFIRSRTVVKALNNQYGTFLREMSTIGGIPYKKGDRVIVVHMRRSRAVNPMRSDFHFMELDYSRYWSTTNA